MTLENIFCTRNYSLLGRWYAVGMASNTNIPDLNAQIKEFKAQAEGFKSKLRSSPTAMGGSSLPSPSDVSNQRELERLQKSVQALTDEKKKAQWYPDNTTSTEEGAVDPGLIGRGLDYLSRPVRGVVGAVKHFTGQGTGTLAQDMADNMLRDKEYFGDVLGKTGIPKGIAAPLGFVLDIGLDPVNWIGVGEAALVPRIVGGAVRGVKAGNVVKGVATATKSGVLEKAVSVGKYTPGFGTFWGGKGTKAFQSLGKKSLAATDEYEAFTGNTAERLVQQRGFGIGDHRTTISSVLGKVAEAIPGGEKVLSHFTYDPVDWVRQTVNLDKVKKAFGTAGIEDVQGALNAHLRGESIEPFLKQAGDQASEILKATPAGSDDIVKGMTEERGMVIDFDKPMSAAAKKDITLALDKLPAGIAERLTQAAPEVVKRVDDAAEIIKNPSIGVTGDSLTNGLRLLGEGEVSNNLLLQEVADIINSGAMGETGVKWFDDMGRNFKNFGAKVGENGERIAGIGEKVTKYYDQYMGLFRASKVGASLTGWTNSIFGNAIMNHLGIGDIGPEYFARYKQVWDAYHGKSGSAALLQSVLMDADVADEVRMGLSVMPTAAASTFGGEINQFIYAKQVADRLLKNVVSEAGRVNKFDTTGMEIDKMAPYMDAALDDLKNFGASIPKGVNAGIRAGTTRVKKLIEEDKNLTRVEAGSDMVSQDLFDLPETRKMFDHIAEKAKADPKNPAWKLLDITFNKMTNQYATFDQVSKMTTFVRSVADGYSMPQLMKARHLIEINPEDIVSKVATNGQYRYRLSARKGVELANALYMNYAAMPSAVRVLRNMPLLGSPFAAFMYGMALKTGQTVVYNPGAFNEVSFAMSEFGGTKTPLEKEALNNKNGFYSYLNAPGMFRVPFFDQNPVYINLANAIPYYSMNMFNPSQQKYNSDALPEKLISAVNQSPFVKDPLGGILFNNIIQPAILSEGIAPQGQFGQPLYPSDANFLTKMGYTARDIGETVVPGVLSMAGGIGGVVAPGATEAFPLYRYRNIANAVQGKNAQGITGKEGKLSRTVRGYGAALGVPIQTPINTTYNNSNQ